MQFSAFLFVQERIGHFLGSNIMGPQKIWVVVGHTILLFEVKKQPFSI
jgi:hypothetical protein